MATLSKESLSTSGSDALDWYLRFSHSLVLLLAMRGRRTASLRLFLLLVLGSFAARSSVPSGCSPPPVVGADRLCWQANVPLRWRDFQASRVQVLASLLDVRVGACSAVEVAVVPYTDTPGHDSFRVESFLVRSRSWVRDSTIVHQPLLLAHEQLHFDINELFARQIRQRLAQAQAAGAYLYGPKVAQQIRLLLTEKTAYQARFDAEAYHDPSAVTLQRWQALVQQQLAELSTYASTAATCGD
jgi:hypothetical protein